MSLVFGNREVSMWPTVGYQGGDAPPQAFVIKGQSSGDDDPAVVSGISCISDLLQSGDGSVERSGFCLDCKESTSSGSTKSSSIGVGGESSSTLEEEEDREDEVQSKFKGGLGSMGSLEDSLPIKRGLSNFFNGKAKSFASLSEASSVEDLAKPENPFNKRKRILMACKTNGSKRTFYSPLNISMPNLALEEETGEEEDKNDFSIAPLPIPGRKFKCFKSPRSFSFTDLCDA